MICFGMQAINIISLSLTLQTLRREHLFTDNNSLLNKWFSFEMTPYAEMSRAGFGSYGWVSDQVGSGWLSYSYIQKNQANSGSSFYNFLCVHHTLQAVITLLWAIKQVFLRISVFHFKKYIQNICKISFIKTKYCFMGLNDIIYIYFPV